MKLKIGNVVFLQKYDVARLIGPCDDCGPREMPRTLIDEIFCGGDEVFFMNGGPDGLRFDVKLTEPENVEWVMNQDYIPDFEKLENCSIEELEKMAAETEKRARAVADDFNNRDIEYRKEHIEEISEVCRKSASAQVGYNFMISYLSGVREFGFPKGYKPSRKVPITSEATNEKKPGFFSRLVGFFTRKNCAQ